MKATLPVPLITPLFALVAFGPTLAGQAPAGTSEAGSYGAAPIAQQSAANPDEQRPRERVLYLRGGRTLRGVARFSEGSWQLERGESWRRLSPAEVLRVREVAEILAEGRELSAGIEADDPSQRVAYADWLFHQGLVPECVAQLDRVLERAPDQRSALRLLADPQLRIGLPSLADGGEGLERSFQLYLNEVARYGPAGRELAIRELALLPAEFALRGQLEGLLVERRPTRRAFAAQALRRHYPGEVVTPLLYRAVLDPDNSVRREAALTLGAGGQEAVALPVIRALQSSSSTVRTQAAEALGHMGFAAAAPALVSRLATLQGTNLGHTSRAHISVGNQLAYVQDFDVQIAAGASIADPVVNVVAEGVILDARVISVQMYREVTEIITIRRSLRQLTGVDAGDDARDWDAWLREYPPAEDL